MRELLDDLMTALTDLLQCGFASCPPETAERLKRLGARCENTGLHTGGDWGTSGRTAPRPGEGPGAADTGGMPYGALCGALQGENVAGFGGGELEK